jgi:hypothetical protein
MQGTGKSIFMIPWQIHLGQCQGNTLHKLLTTYQTLFEGKLGTIPGAPYSIRISQNVKPFVHVAIAKTEIRRLVDIGVITPDADSPWASPCFIILKKDGTVRCLTDFRRLNSQLERRLKICIIRFKYNRTS